MFIDNVFVVIVTYNGKLWYDRCFTSLRNSSTPLNVVVVDNASNDDTVEFIQENYPEIYLITSSENLGFGQGNNLGIKYALNNGADYVFLLNQDAWIEETTISELVRIHKENQEYGILSVMNVSKEKDRLLDGFINYIMDYNNCNPQLFDDLYWGKLKDVYEIKMILAAAWLLPRYTVEQIGGFDPVFFHYGEDDNYAQRVRYHGWKLGICPNLYIVHDVLSHRTDKAVEFRNKKVSEKRNLLLQCCDINNDFSIYNKVFKTLKSLLNKLIKFDYKKAKEEYILFLYLLEMNKKINHSRKNNLIKQTNWL